MADTSPPVTPTWGPGSPPPPGKDRRRTLLAVLIALVVLAGIAVGLLYWLTPERTPTTLPVWITAEPGSASPVPWSAQDRAALLDAGLLGRTIDDPAANPNRDQIRLRFQALSRASRRSPVVVYLAAPAAVDATGMVYILPADPLGDHPRNRLPLADLLAAFRDCPARHRLLVLHLTPPPEDPLFAPPHGDLSAAIFRTLDENPDEYRLCLVACGPGETPLASPDLARTVFGHYVEAGLRGAADGWGGDRDGRVNVNELAAFVRFRVSRWAAAGLRTPQTPVLVGTANDFTLNTYSRSRILEPYPRPPASQSGEGSTPAGFTFPDWLKAGWERHDRWLTDGKVVSAPRAFTRFRSALLTAERDYLAGRPAAEVQQNLERELAAADALAASLSAVPTPNPLPTLAAAFPNYDLPPSDAGLLDELRAATVRADAAPPPPPPPAPAAGQPAPPPPAPTLPPEFDPVKGKPYPVLAVAVFRLLAEAPPSAAQVRRYALLLASKEPVPKYAETLLIQRLAALADPASPVPWSPERAALAIQIARDLEDAASRPDMIEKARRELDEAYRLRADAEATLFAAGYAPPEEADRRLKLAADAATELKAFADQLRSATIARDKATIWMTGAAPAVVSGLIPQPVALRLADATRDLADALDQPPAAPNGPPPSLAQRAAALREKESAVQSALPEFTRPFRPEALARLRTRAEGGDAGAAVMTELDVILRTPLIPMTDRVALWNARAAITRRLSDEVLRKDATEDESFRRELSTPPAPDPRELAPPVPTDPDRLDRQAKWTAALTGSHPAEFANLDPVALAVRLRRVWLEDMVNASRNSPQLVRVAPAVPALAFLDQPARNPITAERQRRAKSLWGWQAARFAYESRNPIDPVPTESSFKFTSTAARACATAADPLTEPYLELDPVPGLVLRASQREAEFNLKVRLLGAAGQRNVAVRVLSPSGEWVRATGDATPEFDPIRGGSVKFRVAAGERPEAHPELKGVLVEATIADGRTYHRRVPVGLDELTNRLNILIRPVADGSRPVRAVELRPNGDPQPYELRLANPGRKPQSVIVRLPQYDRETDKVTIEGGKDVKLKFKPPPPPPTPPVPPPAPPMGAPPPPPVDPFELVRGNELVVVVLDAADPEKELQRLTVPIQVLDPSQYVRVKEVTFTPAIGTRANRLQVDIEPRQVPAGSPVPVVATLPHERNPDVVRVQDANLSAPLPPGGLPLTLYAENTAFQVAPQADTGPPPEEQPRVVVTVAADGVERIFTYTGSLPLLGAKVTLSPMTSPRVQVRAKPLPLDPKQPPVAPPPPTGPVPVKPYTEPVYASGLVPLPLELEVDNAPEGTTVQLRLGTLRPDLSTGMPVFVPDVTLPLSPTEPPIPAKDRTARIQFDNKGETLIFKGTLKDPTTALPVSVLVGERVIEARLIGADGRVLLGADGSEAVGRTRVIFDGAKPTGVEFIGLQPRMAQQKTLALRATSDMPVSGVKEVKFFIGQPVNDAPPPGAALVPGALFDPQANEWRATLPIEGLKDRQVIGVQFVSKAGQQKTGEAVIELIDPAEFNRPPPGSIRGVVIDNRVPQPGLDVFLYDAAAKPIKKATTDANGVYEFKDLPPATYFVYCVNSATRRTRETRVDLKPGAKETVDLELVLPGITPKQ